MIYIELELIPQIKGTNEFFKLIKNGTCEFDDFCEEVIQSTTYVSELKSLFTYMELAANQHPLPQTKCKDITPARSVVRQHEFKSKHLRIYTFQDPGTGKIVVSGGLKNSQKSDIRHFRRIIRMYYENKE